MARAGTNNNWLVFVDTNILLDYYRLGGESADRQLSAFLRHSDKIITTEQLKMEFHKNRQKVLHETFKKIKSPDRPSFPPIVADLKNVEMIKNNHSDNTKRFKSLSQKIANILRNPSRNDSVFKYVNSLLSADSPNNHSTASNILKRQIRTAAMRRFLEGYPPRKGADNSIGDALNWEWIIHCASATKSNVLVVSRDSDYGITLDEKAYINDWLQIEFRKRVSTTRKIELSNRITDALKRLQETVTKADFIAETRLIKDSKPPAISRSLLLRLGSFGNGTVIDVDEDREEEELDLADPDAPYYDEIAEDAEY